MTEAEKIANRAFEIYRDGNRDFRLSPQGFWLTYAYGYMSGSIHSSPERCKEIVCAVYDAEVIFCALCEGLN